MLNTLRTVSSVFFILSAASAAMAVVMYIKLDLYGYRRLVGNGGKEKGQKPEAEEEEKKREDVRKTEKVQAYEDLGNRSLEPFRVIGVAETLKREIVIRDDPPVLSPPPEEPKGKKKGKSLPGKFTIRVMKGGEEGERKKKDEESAWMTEELDKVGPPGMDDSDAKTLQDGSDETMLLNNNVASAREKEQNHDLWMQPARIFRETENAVVVHTDRTALSDGGFFPIRIE